MIYKGWRYYAVYLALRALEKTEWWLWRGAKAADAVYIRLWNWTRR